MLMHRRGFNSIYVVDLLKQMYCKHKVDLFC